jgi:hypothetical protein
MKKQIYILPIAISGFLSGRLADYIVEYLIPFYVNPYFRIIEVVLGLIFATIGLIMGIRTIKLFFDRGDLARSKLYLFLICYSACAGIGITWVMDGFVKSVLVKYLF